MSSELRSRKVYGEVEGYMARTLLKACGFTDDELNQPLIAVVNSWTNIVPGHVHLDIVAEAVEAGVRMAGGTPLQFNTIAACDVEKKCPIYIFDSTLQLLQMSPLQ